MISANDDNRRRQRRIGIDDWEGEAPYIVTMFVPSQAEPFISEMFDALPDALTAAHHYARIHGPAPIIDCTGVSDKLLTAAIQFVVGNQGSVQ